MTIDEVMNGINKAPKGKKYETALELIEKMDDKEEAEMVAPDLLEAAIVDDNSP